MLISYVRNPDNNERIGVIVAISVDNIGWSQCNKKDKFDKERGKEIALGRAMYGTKKKPALVKSTNIRFVREKIGKEDAIYLVGERINLIEMEIEKMRERAKRYYKKEYIKEVKWDSPTLKEV